MDSDPTQWREALDPATGGTYYYHRKTRETTWIRPACLDAPVVVPPSPAAAAAAASASPSLGLRFRSAPDDYAVDEQYQSGGGEEEEEEEDGGQQGGAEDDEGDYAAYVLSQCATMSAKSLLREDPDLIDKLVGISALARRDPGARRASLRSLFLLSAGRGAPRLGFHTSQSWTTLADLVHRWGDGGDFESGILYSGMLSLLLSGAARGVIDQSTLDLLSAWVTTLLGKTNALLDLENELDEQRTAGLSLVDGRILQALSKCSSGQSLPGLTLVLLAKQSFDAEKTAVHFIRVGGFAALQSLCIGGWIPSDVSTQARAVIEHALACSHHIRSALLTSFLTIARASGTMALASGPDPLCTASCLKDVDDDNEDDEDEQEWEGESPDEALEAWKESTLPLQRDVDWKPKHGTSWHVSSVVLWTQCPELRGTIEGLWEETGGELELGTNTSEAALSATVKFLHTGILFPPPTHQARLDLLKLACELGTTALVKEASDAILHQITARDVDSTLDICRSLGLAELERGVGSFRHSGKRPAVSFVSDVADLRQAITSSVLEVNLALSEQPASATQRRSPTSAWGGRLAAPGPAVAVAAVAGPGHAAHGAKAADSLRWGGGGGQQPDGGFRGTPGSKIKSGGIYGLLLEAESGGQPSSSAVGGGGGKAAGSGAAGQGKGRVPGRLPGEPKSRSAFGSSAVPSKAAGNKAAPRGTASKAGGKPQLKPAGDAWMENESGLFEFDNRMSLAPERELSQREKRLSALANPKHHSPSKKEADGEAGEAADASSGPKRAQSPTIASARGRKVDSSSSPSSQNFDEYSQRSSTAAAAPVPLVPLDPNVRSSLVLLKSRSLRRRRSIADVENENEADQDAAALDESSAPEKAAVVPVAHAPRSRVLVSCTKRQGCKCEDCLSSASIAAPFGGKRSDAAASYQQVRNSYELAQAQRETPPVEVGGGGGGGGEDQDEDGDGDGDGYGYSDDGYGEGIVAFKPEPAHVLQTWQTAASKTPYIAPPRDFDDGDGNAEGEGDGNGNGELHQCPDCDRRFRPAALARHAGICKKVFLQKRKVFDSKKMRLTDISAELPKTASTRGGGGGRPSSGGGGGGGGGVAKWKQDSQAFREAMRGAREYSTAVASGAPPPVRESRPDPSYIQCPTCSRFFNQTAGERHIAVCKNIKAKPQALKR